MVKKKTKVAAAAVATFGVAMSSVYVANELQADIMDITWNGGSATAIVPYAGPGSGPLFAFDIDQVPNGIGTTSLGATFEIPDVLQWNDTFGDGVGRTIAIYTSLVPGGVASHAIVSPGDVIDPATFAGETANIAQTELDGSTGSAFVAARPRTEPGNVFWYRIELAPLGSDLVYSGGQYGSMGETLTIPGGKGPCDDAIGDLNGDGMLTLLDVAGFVAAIQDTETYDCEADIDQNGVDDLLDVQPFVALILGGGG